MKATPRTLAELSDVEVSPRRRRWPWVLIALVATVAIFVIIPNIELEPFGGYRVPKQDNYTSRSSIWNGGSDKFNAWFYDRNLPSGNKANSRLNAGQPNPLEVALLKRKELTLGYVNEARVKIGLKALEIDTSSMTQEEYGELKNELLAYFCYDISPGGLTWSEELAEVATMPGPLGDSYCTYRFQWEKYFNSLTPGYYAPPKPEYRNVKEFYAEALNRSDAKYVIELFVPRWPTASIPAYRDGGKGSWWGGDDPLTAYFWLLSDSLEYDPYFQNSTEIGIGVRQETGRGTVIVVLFR